ncbi:unnamed protein product, partial [Ilex paraguariensis]
MLTGEKTHIGAEEEVGNRNTIAESAVYLGISQIFVGSNKMVEGSHGNRVFDTSHGIDPSGFGAQGGTREETGVLPSMTWAPKNGQSDLAA